MYDNTIPQATLPQNGYMQVPPQMSPPTQNIQPRIQQLMQQMRDARGSNPPQDYWRGQIQRQAMNQNQTPGPQPVSGQPLPPTMSPQMMQYLSQNMQGFRPPVAVQPPNYAPMPVTAGAPGTQPVRPLQQLQGLGVSPNFQNRMNYLGGIGNVPYPIVSPN